MPYRILSLSHPRALVNIDDYEPNSSELPSPRSTHRCCRGGLRRSETIRWNIIPLNVYDQQEPAWGSLKSFRSGEADFVCPFRIALEERKQVYSLIDYMRL